MKCRSLIPALVLGLALLATPRSAQAQIPVTDVLHIATTTWAELARYVQAAFEVYQQGTQIYNQVQQIKYQVQALKKLDFHNWRDIGPLYYQLNGILGQAETLTYAVDNLEEQFYATFPGATRYASFPEEQFTAVQRTLDTFRLNLLTLRQIHDDSQGSLQSLGEIQLQVEGADGTQEALETLGELGSWQADQLATMGSTLQAIANAELVAASYQINRDARLKQTHTDTLSATLYRAEADAARVPPSYTLLPSWMPR